MRAGFPVPLSVNICCLLNARAFHKGNTASETDKGIIHMEFPASILLGGQTVKRRNTQGDSR